MMFCDSGRTGPGQHLSEFARNGRKQAAVARVELTRPPQPGQGERKRAFLFSGKAEGNRGAKFEHVTRLAEFGSMKYSTHRTNAIDDCSDPPCEVSDSKVSIAHG